LTAVRKEIEKVEHLVGLWDLSKVVWSDEKTAALRAGRLVSSSVDQLVYVSVAE
jgi:hypothetical protein